MLKDESNLLKKKKRYRPVKCDGYTETGKCNQTIDVNLCIEIEDYDYKDGCKNVIYVYCPACGLQHEYKL